MNFASSPPIVTEQSREDIEKIIVQSSKEPHFVNMKTDSVEVSLLGTIGKNKYSAFKTIRYINCPSHSKPSLTSSGKIFLESKMSGSTINMIDKKGFRNSFNLFNEEDVDNASSIFSRLQIQRRENIGFYQSIVVIQLQKPFVLLKSKRLKQAYLINTANKEVKYLDFGPGHKVSMMNQFNVLRGNASLKFTASDHFKELQTTGCYYLYAVSQVTLSEEEVADAVCKFRFCVNT